MEGLELVQHAISSVVGSKLEPIALTLALLKIDEPLLSPQFDMVVERGAVLEIGHRGANLRSSPVEIGLGSAKFALRRFQLSLEGLNPRLSRASQASLLLKGGLERRLLGEGTLLASPTLLLQHFPCLRLLGLCLSQPQLELDF